jgi:hypothetical protein
MNLLNPYSLLGVTTNSSLNELKKQYYSLALMCHPDKGGNKNDMIIIKNAYNYIKPQLEQNHNKTYEDLEQEFEDFCKIQTEKVGSFSEVYEESHEWIKEFNREFELEKQVNQVSDPFTKGYGHLMDDDKVELNKYSNKVEKDSETKFNKEMIIYEEPNHNPMDFGNLFRFDVENIEDFSDNNNNLNMNDYYQAYSNLDNVEDYKENKYTNSNVKEMYEERMKLYKD